MITVNMPPNGKLEKKYPRIVKDLRDKINDGLVTGALPGVKQLAKEYDVNFMTVNKAIKMLEEEGLVYRIPRKGTYVKHQKNIALCFNDKNPQVLESPVYNSVIMGIQRSLSAQSCSMFFENLYDNRTLPEALSNKIDGLILICDETFIMPDSLKHLPCVQAMGTIRDNVRWDHITYDNHLVGVLAADYLIERGHKTVAFIGHKGGLLFGGRRDSFKHRILEKGASFYEYDSPDDFNYENIAIQMQQLLKTPDRPTAVFCPADGETMMTYNFLYEHGLKPGRDIEVVSCNNELRYLQSHAARPASIDISTEAIGQAVAQRLFERMAAPEAPSYIKLYEPRLVRPDQTI